MEGAGDFAFRDPGCRSKVSVIWGLSSLPMKRLRIHLGKGTREYTLYYFTKFIEADLHHVRGDSQSNQGISEVPEMFHVIVIFDELLDKLLQLFYPVIQESNLIVVTLWESVSMI